MPGWDSLETMAALAGAAQMLSLLLAVLLAAAGVVAYIHMPRWNWPETVTISGLPIRTPWFALERVRLSTRLLETGVLAAFAVLIAMQLAAVGLDLRGNALQASAERARSEQGLGQAARLQRQEKEIAELQRQYKDIEARRAAEAKRSAAEIVSLQLRLKDADNQFVEFQRTLGQRRLTKDEREALIAALKPFAGQKITIASIAGDDESRLMADDLVAVFDAAGWDHSGEEGVAFKTWDRDPVGIEIALNEDDARAGRISAGVGALINAVRRLGLTKDNTIYMHGDVPAGEAQVKVGKKLRK
jgi:hypothetical protein